MFVPSDLLVCVVLVNVLSVWWINGERHVSKKHILNRKTEDLLKNLAHYETVIPELVDHNGVFLSYDVRTSHGVHLKRTKRSVPSFPLYSTQKEHVYYKLEVYGKVYHFNLTLNNNLISKSFVLEYWNKSGFASRVHQHNTCHYVGFSVKPHTSRAAMSNCHGLHGIFLTDDDEYFLEPLWNHSNIITQEGHPHVVYRRSSLKLRNDDLYCGVGDRKTRKWKKWLKSKLPKKHNTILKRWHRALKRRGTGKRRVRSKRRPKRSVSVETNVETLVVVDMEMVKYHGKKEIEPYVLTVMNIVAKLFEDPSIGNLVKIVVTRLIILTEEQPDMVINHHADRTLNRFCRWQKTINPKKGVISSGASHHDNSILITRVDICSYKNEPCGTLGLAPVAGMCEEDRSCSINEDIGLASAFTVAHEIGHNFGMQHDGIGNVCGTPGNEPARIMASRLTKATTPFLWSACSREYITTFLDSGKGRCLENTPPEYDFYVPTELAGQRRDANEQCRLQFFNGSTACKPEVCRELWCVTTKGECLTNSIPAAEGTACMRNSIGLTDEYTGWCYRGSCEDRHVTFHRVDGVWAEWSSWGSCSRTCGGGVQTSVRECENPRPRHGGRYCLGERKRYKSCNTEDCAPNSTDFREVQCTSYDSVPFRGNYYVWKPYTGVQLKPCALTCVAEGFNFYTERAPGVIDGTRCYPDKLDMCINGECHHVGCDKVLDSSAQEDICRVCEGNNDTCETISGVFRSDLPKGAYQEIARIPKGAINIRVKEVNSSRNYLALRNTDTKYFINGEWTIDWPRKFPVAGTTFYYSRPKTGSESFSAIGPTNEDLVVMLLMQETNKGIYYEYNIPHMQSDATQYVWHQSSWTECSETCGKGTKMMYAVCVNTTVNKKVEARHCVAQPRPKEYVESCNDNPCPPEWSTHSWSSCSQTCGHGSESRTVLCIQRRDGKKMILDDVKCNKRKPDTTRQCQMPDCPSIWVTGEWGNCNTTCGEGWMLRRVLCMSHDRKLVLEDKRCTTTNKPFRTRACKMKVCPTARWVLGSWSECSASCGEGYQHRSVRCEDIHTGERVNTCTEHKLISVRKCKRKCEKACKDKDEVSYCPLVLRFSMCDREYFRKLCCKTCFGQ